MTIAPTVARPDGSDPRGRKRPIGATAKAASAHAGPATEAANISPDKGSARRPSATTDTAPATAPASRPQPKVAIMIGSGAR